ncbi:uncharacterized protein CDAR_107081 [Caerostris darwini]|uniref:Uncharacterized protein n=1 Tax=Caerostris darwini TaxID=1538125 RepID=A0AAV4T0A5_9ARAC|nr:uncharacterized protein CDAR_107081 [Caerostris darwini]
MDAREGIGRPLKPKRKVPVVIKNGADSTEGVAHSSRWLGPSAMELSGRRNATNCKLIDFTQTDFKHWNALLLYYADVPQFKTLVTRYSSAPLIDNRKGKFQRGRAIFSAKKLAFHFSAARVCPPLRIFIDAIDLKERTCLQRTGCLFVGKSVLFWKRRRDDFRYLLVGLG